VLHERLGNAWQARVDTVPVIPVLHFTSEGLALGAGTVLVPADGPRRLQSLEGREARVLALLSAAYGRAVPPSVLGNIKRAAKAWGEGDDCLAYIHLAHAGLREPQDPHEAARRLFIVDGFMKAGMSPRAVLETLGFGTAYIDGTVKFDPAEPRVPAGSGRTSGQWTRDGGSDEQPASPRPAQLRLPPILLDEPPVVVRPPLPEFPRSTTEPPGPGYEWHGRAGSNPGDSRGSWYNPETGESLHPDMQHEPPVEPHWDYIAPNGTRYRWFPDGRFEIRS
jgi:hypothetical protein